MKTIKEGDILYAVLKARRKSYYGQEYVVTELCPFCKKNHTHSAENGHRVAHCSMDDYNSTFDRSKVIKTPDGNVSSADGYYIEII